MLRKLSISLIVAMIAIFAFALAVSAQGRWTTGDGANGAGVMMAQRGWQNAAPDGTQPRLNRNSDGTCVNFVDEDGDGVCDNAGSQMGMGNRRGPGMGNVAQAQNGNGNCANFVDEDGDGVCDNAGTQMGAGPMQGGQGGMRGRGGMSGGASMHPYGDGNCDYDMPRDGTGSQNGRQP